MNKAVKILLSQEMNSQKLCNYSSFLCPDQHVAEIEFDPNRGKFCLTQQIITTTNFTGFRRAEFNNNFTPTNDSVMILVLESPHKDEYDHTHKALGPAYGETGDNINTYLADILNVAILNSVLNNQCSLTKYDLILVNAVQHQCSFGANPLLFRDAMFLYYWEKEYYRKDFSKRLTKVISKYNSCIVVNCCTQGEHTDLLTNHFGKLGKGRLKNKSYFDELGVDYSQWGLHEYTLRECVKQIMLSVKSNNVSYSDYYYISHPSSWGRSYRNRILKKI